VIPPKTDGRGSSVNGGELLFLALATCYCNDIYREAGSLGIEVEAVEVEVLGEFHAARQPTEGIRYRVKIASPSAEDEVRRLIEYTDGIAEIQQTVRRQTPVLLESFQISKPTNV
jgi:uncharacterized OsmC-like protein